MLQTLDRVLNALTSEGELSDRAVKILSLILLLIAASICFVSFTKSSLFGLRKISFTLQPTFLTTAVAFAMLLPLYARDILKWSKSIYGLISFVLFWLVFSGLVGIALNGGSLSIPAYLVATSVALSWLGMRGVAGFAWALAFAASIFNIISTNMAMGFYGGLFLACAALGCILHSNMRPSDLFASIKEEFSQHSTKGRAHISDDIDAAKSLLKR